MATVTITITAGNNAGSTFRKMAAQINKIAASVPDVNSTGASYVLTVDNSDNSVAITAGPTTTSKAYF